jgi:predicted nucleotidyltransferase
MASTLDLLRRLVEEGADFVLVGGMAAAVYGSSVLTEDVDICTSFDLKNLQSVLRAFAGLHPRQRMTPSRPPLSENAASFVGWQNLYVITDAGQIDLLAEVTGVGGFQEVSRGALELDLGGFRCRVMGLEDLIRAKRALGRPKDLRVAEELDFILERVRSRR